MAQVLVAEDDRDIRDLIAMLLTRAGHAAETAPDGAEALDRFGRRSFDLVCVDFSMPGLNGIELTRAIRAVDPDVPILLITASASSSDLERAREAGVNAHLGKPFDPARLREQVARLLGDDPATPNGQSR